MIVKDLLDIIKKESLNEYANYIIKTKKDGIISNSYIENENTYGIRENEHDIWVRYDILANNEIIEYPDTYTQDRACKRLMTIKGEKDKKVKRYLKVMRQQF